MEIDDLFEHVLIHQTSGFLGCNEDVWSNLWWFINESTNLRLVANLCLLRGRGMGGRPWISPLICPNGFPSLDTKHSHPKLRFRRGIYGIYHVFHITCTECTVTVCSSKWHATKVPSSSWRFPSCISSWSQRATNVFNAQAWMDVSSTLMTRTSTIFPANST